MSFSMSATSATTMSLSSSASSPDDTASVDSGFASAESSTAALPQVVLTKAHLRHLNDQLEAMHPADILRFVTLLFPNLYQSTAFGLTGLVTLDMLSKIQTSRPVPLIFLDTLYHFSETYDLVDRVRARYPAHEVHVFRPDGAATAAEFEARHGPELYRTAPELYDWLAKVEPQQRAYAELGVAAVLTGRRRSQGGQRGSLPVIEVEEASGSSPAVIKINPLAGWSFRQVQAYVTEHAVPYNALLDRGYKSVGDWHSTSPVAEGEDERAGRWKGQAKTECGIHNKKSRYAQFLEQKAREAEAKERLLQREVQV